MGNKGLCEVGFEIDVDVLYVVLDVFVNNVVVVFDNIVLLIEEV